MRDVRLKAVARAIEARYPGSRVVIEPWEDFEAPVIQWWFSILDVAPRHLVEAGRFAHEVGERLYGGWERCPFYAGAMDRRSSRKFLEEKQALAAARRRFLASRRRRAARTKTRRPAAARRRAAG